MLRRIETSFKKWEKKIPIKGVNMDVHEIVVWNVSPSVRGSVHAACGSGKPLNPTGRAVWVLVAITLNQGRCWKSDFY